MGPAEKMAALLIKISICPNVSTTWLTARSILTCWVTSISTAIAAGPNSLTDLRARSISMSAIATRAPSFI